MFGSQILEVAIGIVFIYLLVSMICSALREALEAWLKTRAAYLERGIREMLHDRSGTGLARSIYEHPLIYSLYTGEYKPGKEWKRPPMFARGHQLPTYIPSANVALALMDMAARGPNPALASDGRAPVLSLASVRSGVSRVGNESVQRVLLTAIDTAQGDLNAAQKTIEDWFDAGMDRVSGWYKRSTQWWLFWIGLFVSVALNVNTVTIADYLYTNDAARAAIVARAQEASKDSTFTNQTYGQARAQLDALNLPIGWQKGWGAPYRHGDPVAQPFAKGPWNNIFGPLLGWLLTAFAATLGAPFWFDLLNKLIVVRSTVKPKEKSAPEGSKDRKQTPQEAAATEAKVERVGVVVEPHDELVAAHIVDGCDVPITRVTPDDELPPAEGGVA